MAAGSLSLALISLGSATGCARHEDPQALNDGRDAVAEVIALLEKGEVAEARQRFDQADASLHETAALVEPVNPETAEVVNDITEYMKGRMVSENADAENLLDIAGRALAWLETAHFDLHDS